jgi:integrase/recombinase XerD
MAAPASVDQSRELGPAAVAHLSRYRGTSREHTESDLRIFFDWCQVHQVPPLAAQRNDLELYLRWLQDVRRFKPSTVSRRLSGRRRLLPNLRHRRRPRALTGRLRPPTGCPAGVADARPDAPGLRSHAHRRKGVHQPVRLRARLPARPLGLRIFETVGADIDDLGEEHGHRVLRVRGKGSKVVLVPLPPAVSRAVDQAAGGRSTGPLLLNRRGVRMDRHAATRRLRHLAAVAGIRRPRMHPHMLRHTFVTTMLDAGVDLRDVQIAARHADPRTTMRYDRARKNLDRHPNYILAAYMASGT